MILWVFTGLRMGLASGFGEEGLGLRALRFGAWILGLVFQGSGPRIQPPWGFFGRLRFQDVRLRDSGSRNGRCPHYPHYEHDHHQGLERSVLRL